MKVTRIDMFPLDVPFTEHVRPHMERALTHGTRLYVYKVYTDTGLTGVGEGPRDDDKIPRYINKNPYDFLLDDTSLGIQMALYDVIGKHAGVPVYRLLGQKIRDYVPIAWWSIDMPPEDWVEEAKTAMQLGYKAYKVKARPWRDIVEQVEALSKTVPEDFKLTVDANSYFLNAGKAVPILEKLERYPIVDCFETPIPQGDVEGYKTIRGKVKRLIAVHFGVPPPITAIREDICDAFIIGGPAGNVLRQAAVAAEANKPFWLQMVGSGITAAFVLHLGAALSHAIMPAITCHELWVDDLITERIEVHGGYAQVPEKPGLGVEFDEATVERYKVVQKKPKPRTVLAVEWRDGRRHYYRHELDMHKAFSQGSEPGFETGVRMEVIQDDGSEAFNKIYAAVQRGPLW